MVSMMKQQIADLNDDVKAKTRELEDEKKLRGQEKIALETELKTLQVDFEDLSQASTRKVEKLKLELQKKENDLIAIQNEDVHGVEKIEELILQNIRLHLRNWSNMDMKNETP